MAGRRRIDAGRAVFAIVVGLLLLYLVFPVAVLAYMSLTAGETLTFPIEGFSLEWYTGLATNDSYVNAAVTSIVIGVSAAAISCTLGGLLAYVVASYELPFKGVLSALAISPLFLPPVTLGVAFLNLFLPMRLAETLLGVIIAHSVFTIPFPFVLTLRALADMNPELKSAAMNLGANTWQSFRTVEFPLMLPSVVAGFIFAFGMSFNEFIIAQLVAGYSVTTLTIQIFSSLRYALSPYIAAVAVVMILATAILTVFAAWLARRGSSSL